MTMTPTSPVVLPFSTHSINGQFPPHLIILRRLHGKVMTVLVCGEERKGSNWGASSKGASAFPINGLFVYKTDEQKYYYTKLKKIKTLHLSSVLDHPLPVPWCYWGFCFSLTQLFQCFCVTVQRGALTSCPFLCSHLEVIFQCIYYLWTKSMHAYICLFIYNLNLAL